MPRRHGFGRGRKGVFHRIPPQMEAELIFPRQRQKEAYISFICMSLSISSDVVIVKKHKQKHFKEEQFQRFVRLFIKSSPLYGYKIDVPIP